MPGVFLCLTASYDVMCAALISTDEPPLPTRCIVHGKLYYGWPGASGLPRRVVQGLTPRLRHGRKHSSAVDRPAWPHGGPPEQLKALHLLKGACLPAVPAGFEGQRVTVRPSPLARRRLRLRPPWASWRHRSGRHRSRKPPGPAGQYLPRHTASLARPPHTSTGP